MPLHSFDFQLTETLHDQATSMLLKCAKFVSATYLVCFLLAEHQVLSVLEHSDGNLVESYNRGHSLLLEVVYFQIFDHLPEQRALHVGSEAVLRQITVSRATVVSYIFLAKLKVQISNCFPFSAISRGFGVLGFWGFGGG